MRSYSLKFAFFVPDLDNNGCIRSKKESKLIVEIPDWNQSIQSIDYIVWVHTRYALVN